MLGHFFTKFIDSEKKTPFDRLYEVFMELLVYTSGDVEEALDWLKQLDKEYKLTDENYTMDDFVDELRQRKIIQDNINKSGPKLSITSKAEQIIRKRSLDQIFGKLKKGGRGNHVTNFYGSSEEKSAETKAFEFGDNLDDVAFTNSIKNAQVNHGLDEFKLTEGDLEVSDNFYQTNFSTVLMIDISHSMILYGEDRITPAKKVAMALSELIRMKYPKDSLDIIVFGNDAWQISIKDLPYLQVGPYHTNTVAGLELAMDILRRKKTSNKQIFMITDGKPSCLKEKGEYYKNSFGLDDRIVSKCLNLAAACKKNKIPITTFMIAQDPYLQSFVQRFTEANAGKAFYTSLKGLGNFIFEDFQKNRRKNTN